MADRKRLPGMSAPCSKCKDTLESSCFRTRVVSGRTYLRSICKKCEKPTVDRAIRKWQKNNVDRMRATAMVYRLKHPDRVSASNRRRRARLVSAAVLLTKAQWEEILVLFGFCCFYCGRKGLPLTQDHVMPLSRGGNHVFGNVVPACKPCNSSKRDRTPEEWLERKVGTCGTTNQRPRG